MKPIADLMESFSALVTEKKDESASAEESFEGFIDYVKEKLGIRQENVKESGTHEDKSRKSSVLPDFGGLKQLVTSDTSNNIRNKKRLRRKHKSFSDILENLFSMSGRTHANRRSTVESRAQTVEFYRKKYGL